MDLFVLLFDDSVFLRDNLIFAVHPLVLFTYLILPPLQLLLIFPALGGIFIVLLLVIWEITAKAHVFGKRSEIVFPTLEAIGAAFIKNFTLWH